jgi:hypothetical protein
VVAKVEGYVGELFLWVSFLMTNLKGRSQKIVHFSNRRGTAGQWIKEGKNAVKWTKLSCRRFKDNAARLHLFALAYNLVNFLRQLALPQAIQGWTLTTLRAGAADQDRGQGGEALEVHHFSAGQGSRAAQALRKHFGPDRVPAAGLCLRLRESVPENAAPKFVAQ